MTGRTIHEEEICAAQPPKSFEENFSLLFNECYRPVCHYAFSILNNMAEAEDITDECFMKLWEVRKDASKIKCVEAYLYTCVRNACFAELKNKKGLAARKKEFQYISSDEEYYTEPTESIYPSLQDLLNTLTPKRRQVFSMIYRDNKKIGEIASQLKISVNTVKNHKKQSVYYLRKKFLPSLFK